MGVTAPVDYLQALAGFEAVRDLVSDAKYVEKIVSHIHAVTLAAGPRAAAQGRFLALARRRGWSLSWPDRPTAPIDIVLGFDAFQRVAHPIAGHTVLIGLYILARHSNLRSTMLASGPDPGYGLRVENIAVRIRGPRNAVACWMALIHVLQQDETWLHLLRPLIDHAINPPPEPAPPEPAPVPPAPPPSAFNGPPPMEPTPAPPPPLPPVEEPKRQEPRQKFERDFVDNGLGLYEGLRADVGIIAQGALDLAPGLHDPPTGHSWRFLHFTKTIGTGFNVTDRIRPPIGTYFMLNTTPALRYWDVMPMERRE